MTYKALGVVAVCAAVLTIGASGAGAAYAPPDNEARGNQNWLYYGDISAAKWDKRVGYRMGSVCDGGWPACYPDDFTYAGIWSWHLNGDPFSALTELSARYWMDTDVCVGGSPRFSIFLDADGDGSPDNVVWAYLGNAPSLTPCATDAWTWTGNLLTNPSIRFDVSGAVGYKYGQTWAQVVGWVGSNDIYGIAFDVDSGWLTGQDIYVDDVQVNNHTFENLSKGIRA